MWRKLIPHSLCTYLSLTAKLGLIIVFKIRKCSLFVFFLKSYLIDISKYLKKKIYDIILSLLFTQKNIGIFPIARESFRQMWEFWVAIATDSWVPCIWFFPPLEEEIWLITTREWSRGTGWFMWKTSD